ncbi:hypothetical protein BH24ACT26_BH24ACT26_04960 [soil metagenome]
MTATPLSTGARWPSSTEANAVLYTERTLPWAGAPACTRS